MLCLFAAEDQRHTLVKTTAMATPHQDPDDSFRTPQGVCLCVHVCGVCVCVCVYACVCVCLLHT